MAKSKLKGSWGGKIEAQGVLGSQNRRSSELRGRLGVGPGGLWASSGSSKGVEGGHPRNFGVELSFYFWAEIIMKLCQTNPSSSDESGAKYF